MSAPTPEDLAALDESRKIAQEAYEIAIEALKQDAADADEKVGEASRLLSGLAATLKTLVRISSGVRSETEE
jgi:hypothetical protein